MIRTLVASPRRIHPRWISPFVLLGLILLATACSDTPPPELSSADVNTATVRFTSVTEEAGLTSFQHVNGNARQFWMLELMGSGGGFIDYDGDGRLDVLLVGGGSLPGGPQADVPALCSIVTPATLDQVPRIVVRGRLLPSRRSRTRWASAPSGPTRLG